MSSHDNRATRAIAAPGAEEPERLLRRSRHNVLNNRETGGVGTDAQEQSPLPTQCETKRDIPSLVISDQAGREERPTSTETVPVALRTSNQLLVRKAVTGIPVHIEASLSKLVLETLTSSLEGVDNLVSTTLETLVLHTVRKVVNSREFVRQFLDAVLDKHGFINPVAGTS